jgi:hypothetical protein
MTGGGRPRRPGQNGVPLVDSERLSVGSQGCLHSSARRVARSIRLPKLRPVRVWPALTSGSSCPRQAEHPRGITEGVQQQVPPTREGNYDYRDHPGVRHRAARDPRAHVVRQRTLGLHCVDRRRHCRSAERHGRSLGDRDLPSPLLHHDGGVEPRARRSADLPARSRS